jgi:hypothetical protein
MAVNTSETVEKNSVLSAHIAAASAATMLPPGWIDGDGWCFSIVRAISALSQ